MCRSRTDVLNVPFNSTTCYPKSVEFYCPLLLYIEMDDAIQMYIFFVADKLARRTLCRRVHVKQDVLHNEYRFVCVFIG